MARTSPADAIISGSPPGEPLDSRRRRQLIDATIRAIATHGLSGTTLAKVAKVAGLSTGIVNFYFQTKDALLLATLQTVDREFVDQQREALEKAGDDPVRQLEAMIEVDFDPTVSDPDRIAVWSAFWGEARARADYQRVCGRRELEDARRVSDLFVQIARRGGYPQLDPRALGRAFYHLLSSLPEEMLEDPTSFDREAAKATCRGFLASIFPAEFAAPAPGVETGPGVRVLSTGAERKRTLPGWVYHAPELHELEMQAVFRKHWLLVGHAAQVPEPGDYLTLDVGRERVLVIRGSDGRLCAFHNVCRHRASRLVSGEAGHCEGAIVCPSHGWRYDLDGRLTGVPAAGTFPGLDTARLGLSELELDEWMGFVYVRFESAGPDVRSPMRPFDDEARQHRLSQMRPWGRRWTRRCDFDWKILAESLAEEHRLPGGRPGLQSLMEARDGEGSDFGWVSRQLCVIREAQSTAWSERMYQGLLPALDAVPAPLHRVWVHYRTFPGAVLVLAPDRVDAYQVLPLGPQRCRIHGFSLALDDDRRKVRAARYLHTRILRRVIAEELESCAGIASGLHSSGHHSGPLSRLESGVRRFQDRLRELVPVVRSEQAPPPGMLAARNEEMGARG